METMSSHKPQKGTMHYTPTRMIFFVLFTLSGFSGLIYESIWSHYLKLLLGHAAYAQALVLMIFMGGMAIGAWLAGRYTSRWKKLLLGYAVTEGVIGLCAIFFHPIFVLMIEITHTHVLPHLGDPALAIVAKWGLGSLVILPQSILLGMTFPLMTAAIVRRFPANPGMTLATLYFTNSFGAAVGVIVSGFILVGHIGLPGAITVAGVINIALAVTVWLLQRQPATGTDSAVSALKAEIPSDRQGQLPLARGYSFLLLAALITGLSSFIYEIAWVRMLSLVLGASTHAFELMLSAFILGLACGGLWMRKRLDRLSDPRRFLGWVQVTMGLLALASVPLYAGSFDVMSWLLRNLLRTDTGYQLFNVASHGIALAVMLPATFCAGMTLPLITFILLRSHGERSIGSVYAANTVGAILGVVVAVHFGLPLLGLKGTIGTGAMLDLALGVILLSQSESARNRLTIPALATAISLASLVATLQWMHLDARKLASGIYRLGQFLPPASQVLYHRDGKTASVDLVRTGQFLSIRTNGKPDATLRVPGTDTITPDESTSILAAVIPLAHHPAAKTAAVIGMGSGLTTHTLLTAPMLTRVDTIEIEPAIIDAAQGFRPRTALAYEDPRSHIHIEDAKTFFSVQNRQYDIIVSEPSNPWVSGVAGLFSQEFYSVARRHLNHDGVLVQWLQLYEIDIPLVASVIKALDRSFSDYTIYATNGMDILILARNGSSASAYDPAVLRVPGIARELSGIGINHLQDFNLRIVGTKRILHPAFLEQAIAANSDYLPLLDVNSARTRFLRSSAEGLSGLGYMPLPIVEMLGIPRPRDATQATPVEQLPRTLLVWRAAVLRDHFTGRGNPQDYMQLPDDSRRSAEAVRLYPRVCNTRGADVVGIWLDSLFNVVNSLVPHLGADEFASVWNAIEPSPSCQARLTPLQRDWLSLFRATGLRDARTMANDAQAILQSSEPSSPDARAYALAAGMLAQLSLGHKQESERLWINYSARILDGGEPSFALNLLRAHARVAGAYP